MCGPLCGVQASALSSVIAKVTMMNQALVDELLAEISAGKALILASENGRTTILTEDNDGNTRGPIVGVGGAELNHLTARHPDKVKWRQIETGPDNKTIVTERPMGFVAVPPPVRPLIDYPLYPIEQRPRCFFSQVLVDHLRENNPSRMTRYSLQAFRDRHGEHLVSPRIATRLPEFVIKWMIRRDLRGDMWLERDGHIYVRTQWLLSRFGSDRSLRHALARMAHEAL